MTDDELVALGTRLRVLALRLVADESVADDLAQEAWLVLRRRGDLRVGDVGAYLGGVLRNLSLRQRSKDGNRRARERVAAREEAVASAQQLDSTLDAQQDLVTALRELPDDLRESLLLRYYEGLSAADIARRLRLPASTVRSRLARGLAELRMAMDRRHGGSRLTWAVALLRMPGEVEAAGASSVPLGGVGLSFALKCGLAAGMVLVGVALWSGQKDLRPTEAAALTIAESPPEQEASVEAPTDELFQAPEVVQRVAVEADAEEQATSTGVAEENTPERTVRVIDRRTGRPLAGYSVVVEGRGVPRFSTTDTKGEFVLPAELDQPNSTLTAVDNIHVQNRNPEVLRLKDLAVVDPAAVIEIEVNVGPTYHLDLPASTPTGSYLEERASVAFKLGRPPRVRDVEIYAELSSSGFSTRSSGRLFGEGSTVYMGQDPWVRFSPSENLEARLGPEPWYLRLTDGRGLWQAWGRVDSLVGEQARRVTFEGGGFGRLKIDAGASEGIADIGTIATIRPMDTADVGNGDPLRASIRRISKSQFKRGDASLNYLPAGEYEAKIGGPVYQQVTRKFSVVEGQVTDLRVTLKRKPGGHDLLVVLTSETGEIGFAQVVVQAHPTRPEQGTMRRVHGRQGTSKAEWLYTFQGLGAGPWRIELVRAEHLPAFDLDPGVLVAADVPELRFTCLDSQGPGMVAPTVKILDASTGEDLRSASITLWVEGERYGTRSIGPLGGELVSSTRTMQSMRVGASFDCLVHERGYQPFYLKDGSYPPKLPGGDVGEFRLKPGWGTMIFTYTRTNGKTVPVPGVEILVDGQRAGVTDSLGRLLLVADQPPKVIEGRHEEYELFEDEEHPATGEFSWSPELGMCRVPFVPR